MPRQTIGGKSGQLRGRASGWDTNQRMGLERRRRVAHTQEGLGEHRQEEHKMEAQHATSERLTGQSGASACGTGSHRARRCTNKTRFYRTCLHTGELIVAHHELSRTRFADCASTGMLATASDF
jgi:hypothetical protein